jgi:hypothetical protein
VFAVVTAVGPAFAVGRRPPPEQLASLTGVDPVVSANRSVSAEGLELEVVRGRPTDAVMA